MEDTVSHIKSIKGHIVIDWSNDGSMSLTDTITMTREDGTEEIRTFGPNEKFKNKVTIFVDNEPHKIGHFGPCCNCVYRPGES